MLSFFTKSPEEKLAEYDNLNQSYLKYRPLDKSEQQNIEYISIFKPEKKLSGVSLLSYDKKDQKQEAPVNVGLGKITNEAISKIDENTHGSIGTLGKIAVKVNEGDSIKNYSNNKFFKSILNLDIPKEDKAYLMQMGYLESRFNPTADNKRGYKGGYQFGKMALKEVGMTNNEYMKNMNNQHIAALKLRDINLGNLRNYNKYIGKVVNGILITASGLAAGAHLVGASAVKNFFDKGIIEKDGNGTPITKYFKDFSHIG